MSLEDVARELYALPPAEFTAARNARAATLRAQGDRPLADAVKRLRRASVGAWAIDLLVREHLDEVEPLVELGGRLRAAMGVLGADELRALDRQRRELTRAVAGRAVAVATSAGVRATPQVAADIEESLRSAMVDERAGAALLTGLLTDTFTSTGLDPVEVERVLAVPDLLPPVMSLVPDSPGGRMAGDHEDGGPGGDTVATAVDPTAARRAAVAQARADVREAADARSAAEDVAAEAARAATRARTARLELEARRDELRRALKAAESALATAVGAEEAADERSAAAARDIEPARRAEAAARSHLDAVVADAGPAPG